MTTRDGDPAICIHCSHDLAAHEWRGDYAICSGNDFECDCDGSDGPNDGQLPEIPLPPRSELSDLLDERDRVH